MDREPEMKDLCSLESNRLLSVEEALDGIETTILPLAGQEKTAINEASGRILAQAVYSSINIPYDRNAAMDGYALRSSDIVPGQPFSLRLAGSSWAGRPFDGQLQAGECIRIFTGAVVPPMADSVVMQEEAVAEGQNILFPANTGARQNIREAGEDIKPGSLLVAEGKKLTPMDIALLASAGIYEIDVKRRLRIAYFSTGDELIALGQPPESGKIYDSNRYGLSGLLKDPSYSIADLGRIADNKSVLESCLLEASKDFDVIITTGGVSVGEADYMRELLEQLGQVHFWKIAIKPGKPLVFGMINRCYYFGLPGNPVSVFVTFQQIVEPALRRLSGARPARRLRIKATCTSRLRKAAGRQEFQRGILTQGPDGEFFVASSGGQGSHRLEPLSRSHCYIVLPADCQGVQPGDTVLVEPFSLYL
ncbi:MAG: molybdopterin molybdotransferase MoeA [Methylosarcina sp.]